MAERDNRSGVGPAPSELAHATSDLGPDIREGLNGYSFVDSSAPLTASFPTGSGQLEPNSDAVSTDPEGNRSLSVVSDIGGGDGGNWNRNNFPGNDEAGEHDITSMHVGWLENGDVETAKAVLDIIHSVPPGTFVSPHKHYSEDPECKDIFGKVKDEDYKIAVIKDQNGRIVGTATLNYKADRDRSVQWYTGGLSKEARGRDLGPMFIEALTRKTFKTPSVTKKWGTRYPRLILCEVIIPEPAADMEYSPAIAKRFSPMYQLLRRLPYVHYVGKYRDLIASDEDGNNGNTPEEVRTFFSEGIFGIHIADFAAHTGESIAQLRQETES